MGGAVKTVASGELFCMCLSYISVLVIVLRNIFFFFLPLECLQNCGVESLTVISWYCMCVQSATECGKVFVISRTNECKVLCTLGKPSSQTCYKARFIIQIISNAQYGHAALRM